MVGGRNIYYQRVRNCRQGKRKEGVMLSHRTNVNISVQKDLDSVKPSGCFPVHSTQSKQGFGPCSKGGVYPNVIG